TDTGEGLAEAGVTPLTAHAYLGGLPIAKALAAGADVVVTGRVTDAALVVGPGMWRFGWTGDDLDELAGAVVAGHIIECGWPATAGEPEGLAQLHGRVPELHDPLDRRPRRRRQGAARRAGDLGQGRRRQGRVRGRRRRAGRI